MSYVHTLRSKELKSGELVPLPRIPSDQMFVTAHEHFTVGNITPGPDRCWEGMHFREVESDRPCEIDGEGTMWYQSQDIILHPIRGDNYVLRNPIEDINSTPLSRNRYPVIECV